MTTTNGTNLEGLTITDRIGVSGRKVWTVARHGRTLATVCQQPRGRGYRVLVKGDTSDRIAPTLDDAIAVAVAAR